MSLFGQGAIPLVITEDRTRKRLPPYVSYRTFRNFLDELQQHTVPARIDRSFWGERMSGSTGNQLLAALRFLGLIDGNDVPTDRLRKLAIYRGTQRNELLRQITSDAFSFLSGVDKQSGTYQQVSDAIHANFHLTSDVCRKCIKFYVAITADAGINLSNYITNKVRTVKIGNGIKGVPKRKNSRTDIVAKIPQRMELMPDNGSLDKMLLAKFPDLDPGWSEELKIYWFKDYDILLRIHTGKNGSS